MALVVILGQSIFMSTGFVKQSIGNWILTISGLGGWLSEHTGCYSLGGDWFIGCILIIYALFPLIYKAVKKYPYVTLVIYIIIFLFWEYFYPFDFRKRNSIILRMLEVLLGMWYIRCNIQKSKIMVGTAAVVAAILWLVRIDMVSLYVLVPVAGFCAWVILRFIADLIKSQKVESIIMWISKYSFGIFLLHYFILDCFLSMIPNSSLSVLQMILLFVVYVCAAVMAGFALVKMQRSISSRLILKRRA